MATPALATTFDAFDALPDPACVLAANGALIRANPAFHAAFKHAISPLRPPWGRFAPPDYTNGERRFDAPSPDGRHFSWVERLLPDGARIAVAHDVTDHARAAEEAMRGKTTLFATLTHELRTPLNGILGMAGLLELAKLEPNAREYVGFIKQSGEHLLELITEILDYSRIEAGHVALENAAFDPEAVMQDVAELLSPKAQSKGLEVTTAVRADSPRTVIGDDGRLRQILFNLAGNAVKFTETGGVTIDMAPRAGGRLRFSVRDTGPGVPPEKQALIFEEFAQADAGVARRHGGAGLGLAIVRKLARAMGGEVGLVSRPGFGAAFWVELPFEVVEGEAPPPPLPGVRIAVVSASPVLTQSLRAMAASLGALAVTPDETPDVVLYDWRESQGGGDGEEIAALKSRARALIALLPQERRETIDAARAAGFEHYTLKPVRRRSLVERVRLALGESATPSSARAADPPAALAGLRVLLAEDNPVNAILARTLLTRAGCVVAAVQDGEEAVAAAAAGAFDLILMDIRMPRLDGLEAAQRIRTGAGPNAEAPIVALTADAGGEERAQALKAGMDDFLTKPVDADRLIAVAERLSRRPNPATFGGE